MAKYRHNLYEEEEYIDLILILENLYIAPKEFLNKIKEVFLLIEKSQKYKRLSKKIIKICI